MVKLCSTIWTYFILFIHSSVHGHLGSSHLLHIMNRVVMIMCVRFAWKHLSGTDKFCGNSMFMYWRIFKVFSTMLLNFKVPEAMYEGSDFSTCSLTFLFLGLNKKYIYYFNFGGILGISAGKESTCNAEHASWIPGSGSCPGEVIGYPLQYSWASLVAQMVKNPPAMRETWVQSLSCGEGMATHSSILAWRSLECYTP